MKTIKITPNLLDIARDFSKKYYINDANHSGLTAEQWNMLCIIKGLENVLQLKELINLEYPAPRKELTGYDDENG